MVNSLLNYLDISNVKKQLDAFCCDHWLYVKETRCPAMVQEDKKIQHFEDININHLKGDYDSNFYVKENVNDSKMYYRIDHKIPSDIKSNF